MINKLDKLRELNELLKSGAISIQEFESLKNELINSSDIVNCPPIQDVKKQIYQDENKEKIILKSFNDNKGILIMAPDIQYVNFKNLSESEIKLLKPFIKKKHTYASFDFTNDEKTLLNKFFSRLEIEQFSSEREGYNFPLFSSCSFLSAVLAILLIKISPCMMYFGGIPLIGNSLIMSLYVITRVSATKSDKTTSAVAIILVVFAFVYFGISWQETMNN